MHHLSLRTVAILAAVSATSAAQEFTAGHLLLAAPNGVIELDAEGSVVRTIDLESEVTDVVFSPRGTVFASLFDRDEIVEINGDGAIVDTLTHASLVQPTGLALGPWGELYATAWLSDRIFEFDHEGTLNRTFGNFSISGGAGIEVGPDGHILVCSSIDDRINEYDPGGAFLQSVTTGTLVGVRDLATTARGTTLVATAGGSAIYEISESGAVLATEAFPGGSPQALANGPDNLVYVANISIVSRYALDESGFTFVDDFALVDQGVGSINGMTFVPQRFVAAVKGQVVSPDGILKVTETATVSVFPGDFQTLIDPHDDGVLSPAVTLFAGKGPEVAYTNSARKRRVHSVMTGHNTAPYGVSECALDLKGAPDDNERFDVKAIRGTLHVFGVGRSIEVRVSARGKKAKLN